MFRIRYRLLVALIPSLAFALMLPLQAGAANTFNQQVPFSVVIVNPCPPGNPISITGNIHIVGTFTIDSSSGDPTGASGGVHGTLSSNFDSISAFDTVTGTPYQFHQNGQTSDGFPPDFFKFNVNARPGSEIEFTQDLHGGFEGRGSVPDVNFAMRLHMTFLSDGTLTADVNTFTLTCK
jgi:hypothetical protein